MDHLFHGTKTRAELDRSYINPDYSLTNAVVSNQEYYQRESMRVVAEDAIQMLRDAGIDAKPNNRPDVDFFENQIYNYDIIFHIGHGVYDDLEKLHWFLTLQEVSSDDWIDLINKYPTDQVSVTRHNNKRVAKISEKLIGASKIKFNKPGKSIFFSVPCESLKGAANIFVDNNKQDFSFADSLIKNGLGLYLGYDETNNIGHLAGLLFLGKLVSGMSIDNSRKTLLYNYQHNTIDKGDWSFTADLFPSYLDKSLGNSSLTRPVMGDVEDVETNEGSVLKLKATSILYTDLVKKNDEYKMYSRYVEGFLISDFLYGFEMSESPNFNNVTQLSKMSVGTVDSKERKRCVNSENKANLNQVIPLDNLEPETTYYFRAFFDDGHEIHYSDYKEYTTPKRIDQVIPENIRERMDPYITIYEGNTPPVIEGVFVQSPSQITYDSTNGFEKGHKFADYYWKFSNQDALSNTLDFEGKEISDSKTLSHTEGPGAFISGTGDNFTVFFNIKGVSYHENYNVDFTEALVISGTMTSTGIKNAEYAFVLLSKSDDPNKYVIPAESFRVFMDGDGLASKATWPSYARNWGWGYDVKGGRITTPWSIYAAKK